MRPFLAFAQARHRMKLLKNAKKWPFWLRKAQKIEFLKKSRFFKFILSIYTLGWRHTAGEIHIFEVDSRVCMDKSQNFGLFFEPSKFELFLYLFLWCYKSIKYIDFLRFYPKKRGLFCVPQARHRIFLETFQKMHFFKFIQICPGETQGPAQLPYIFDV